MRLSLGRSTHTSRWRRFTGSDQNLDLAIERLGQAIALSPDQPALFRMRARWNLEQRDITPELRAAALGDLREAIKREGQETAVTGDMRAVVARLLLDDKRLRGGTARERRVAANQPQEFRSAALEDRGSSGAEAI